MDQKLIEFDNVYLKAESCIVGKKEHEGPLGRWFDVYENDEYFGCKSFEDAETEMIRRNLNMLMAKAKSDYSSLDVIFGGDLLNQCTAASFAVSDTDVPYMGLYGACSTISESIIAAGVFIKAGVAHNAVGFASSHFCSSERQYRFPLEYGSVRTPTSQNTVTGTGAYYLTDEKCDIKIAEGMIGRIIDKRITDANNMGAAMAPAAVDTIERYFEASKYEPDDFDIITTGDLGIEGHQIANELLHRDGIELDCIFTDCGRIIYNQDKQDTHSGGSGCGCLASVLSAHFLSRMRGGEIKRILAVGTGALLNPVSVFQKKSIPAIAHAVCIESEA